MTTNKIMSKIILNISLYEAKILYEQASLERRLELEELFSELKPISIIDRVKTYEDALRVLGKKDFNRENLYPREIARRKLEIIIEALNEGWKPDFNNIKQSKWYCFFNWSITGLEYSVSSYSPTNANANIGGRLCLKDKILANYIGEQFIYLFEEILLDN